MFLLILYVVLVDHKHTKQKSISLYFNYLFVKCIVTYRISSFFSQFNNKRRTCSSLYDQRAASRWVASGSV